MITVEPSQAIDLRAAAADYVAGDLTAEETAAPAPLFMTPTTGILPAILFIPLSATAEAVLQATSISFTLRLTRNFVICAENIFTAFFKKFLFLQ